MKNTKDTKRNKFTTNLSNDCLEGFKIIRSKYGIKYDNHIIEYLVQKEVSIINKGDKEYNEMDKQEKE